MVYVYIRVLFSQTRFGPKHGFESLVNITTIYRKYIYLVYHENFSLAYFFGWEGFGLEQLDMFLKDFFKINMSCFKVLYIFFVFYFDRKIYKFEKVIPLA